MSMRRAVLKVALYGAVIAVVTLGAAAAFAWTGPSANPPSGNTSAPINVSSIAQTKSGQLNIDTTLTNLTNSLYIDPSGGAYTSSNALLIDLPSNSSGSNFIHARTNNAEEFYVTSSGNVSANQYCFIGGNCISSWPAGVSSQWTSNGSSIYYNGGNVGIGTANPQHSLSVNGWIGTQGVDGWYNETYGGGWYMQDSSWIRAYNAAVYMPNGFDSAGGTAGVNCGGGMGNGYTLRVCGSENVTGGLYSNGNPVLTTGATYVTGDVCGGVLHNCTTYATCSSGGYMIGYEVDETNASGAVVWGTVSAECEY